MSRLFRVKDETTAKCAGKKIMDRHYYLIIVMFTSSLKFIFQNQRHDKIKNNTRSSN